MSIGIFNKIFMPLTYNILGKTTVCQTENLLSGQIYPIFPAQTAAYTVLAASPIHPPKGENGQVSGTASRSETEKITPYPLGRLELLSSRREKKV